MVLCCHSSLLICTLVGNHTIALVKTNEDYNNLLASLANVIADVNSLIKQQSIKVGKNNINLQFYLGGDYKFLLLAHGMKSATSNNSCIWCKICKNDRFALLC